MKIEQYPLGESYAIQYEAHHVAPNLEQLREAEIVKHALSLPPSIIKRQHVSDQLVTKLDELALRLDNTETEPSLLIPSRSGSSAAELPRTHIHKIGDLALIASALGAFVDDTSPFLEQMERSGAIGIGFPARRAAGRSAQTMLNTLQGLPGISMLPLGDAEDNTTAHSRPGLYL